MERHILKEINSNEGIQNHQNKPTLPVVETSEQLKITPETLTNNKKDQQLLIYDYSLENHQKHLSANVPISSPEFDDSFILRTEGSVPKGNSTFLANPATSAIVCSDDEESFAECQSFVDLETASFRGEQFFSQANSVDNSSENLLKLNETETFVKTKLNDESHKTVSSSTFIGDWNVSEIKSDLPSESLIINNSTKINDSENITSPSTNTTLSVTGKLNQSFIVEKSAISVSEISDQQISLNATREVRESNEALNVVQKNPDSFLPDQTNESSVLDVEATQENLSYKELKNIENICVKNSQSDLKSELEIQEQLPTTESDSEVVSVESHEEHRADETLNQPTLEVAKRAEESGEIIESPIIQTPSIVIHSVEVETIETITGVDNSGDDKFEAVATVPVSTEATEVLGSQSSPAESFSSALDSSPTINSPLIIDPTSTLSVYVEESTDDSSLPYFNASSITPTINNLNRSFNTPAKELPELQEYNSFSDLQTSIELDSTINHNEIIEAKMPELFSPPSDSDLYELSHLGKGDYRDQSPETNSHGDEMMDVDETICENAEKRSSVSPAKHVFAKSLSQENNLVIGENFVAESFDVTFKTPSLPAAANLGGNKRRSDDCNNFGSASSVSFSDDEFRTTSIQFSDSDFDFLLSKGCSNTDDIRRDSILSTFDPLLKKQVLANQTTAKRLSAQLLASKVGQSTEFDCSKEYLAHIESIEELANESDCKLTKIKPDYSDSNDIKFDSTVSIKEKPKSQNVSVSSINSQEEHATMSVGVMTDMLIENNISDNSSFKKMSEQNAELEKKIQNEVTKTEDIEKKLKDAEQREELLIKRISEKDRNITKMTGIVEAYEKAIAELISEKEQIVQNYEKKCAELQGDSDSNAQHLASLETTFSDVHIKYERTKKMAKELSDKVDQLLQEKQENLDCLHVQEQRYEKMKSHAMSQLDIANKNLADMAKNHQMEVTKLKALLKKEEIARASTHEQLQQKTRENSELMKICDELINNGQTS